MDRDQPELATPAVDEAMGLARRADDDMAGWDDQSLLADLKRCLARLDQKHLGVRMSMKLRPDSWLRVHQDDRERNIIVICADELMRVWLVRQFVQTEDLGHGHLRLTLTVPTLGRRRGPPGDRRT